mmetsp:Transcript_11035/g.9767  ORF Transcript_11035/g.9767 Transcript_11035/m.9767 type:complete len:162 (+) Transcript_11035:820-1305(+)
MSSEEFAYESGGKIKRKDKNPNFSKLFNNYENAYNDRQRIEKNNSRVQFEKEISSNERKIYPKYNSSKCVPKFKDNSFRKTLNGFNFKMTGEYGTLFVGNKSSEENSTAEDEDERRELEIITKNRESSIQIRTDPTGFPSNKKIIQVRHNSTNRVSERKQV